MDYREIDKFIADTLFTGMYTNKIPKFSRDSRAALLIINHQDGWGYDWVLQRDTMSSRPWQCTATSVTDGWSCSSFGATTAEVICAVTLQIIGD